ncbi:SprT-like family protein [Enhygromyxa salina]|uniref:SprT-like family protein n=1 Tax=Enhygromyxa salina TaxID=215803 RepID=A0A2S9YBU7_9BACT|nr:SprT family zinc-dependent metalloprotease [Enhygromyxa salina]PRQ02573.1 SprT-like family protein [Enhygromyxa salina]
MSRSSAAKRRLQPQPRADGRSWVADDGAHELAREVEAELEAELELGDCASSDPDDTPFVEENYSALPGSQQEVLRVELQDRLGAYLSRGRARVVITDNLRTMMSVKRGQGVYTFRLHHMFIDAPPTILRGVVAYAERQDPAASELLRSFIDANEDAIRQRSGARPLSIDVEGRFANLQEIFDELNEYYFGGAIKARITWGPRTKRKRKRASIKLGSYTVEDELIRVHPVLDAEDVPRHYLAWVVYHEMLHEIHDMPIVDGRRVYHTRAFRQAEAKFEQYAEAVLWERQNLHKLLDR